MDIKKAKFVFKMTTMLSSGYVTYRLLDKKTKDIVREGTAVNAFVHGYGEGAISLAVGIVVAAIIDATL
jgi:hypothetical protein